MKVESYAGWYAVYVTQISMNDPISSWDMRSVSDVRPTSVTLATSEHCQVSLITNVSGYSLVDKFRQSRLTLQLYLSKDRSGLRNIRVCDSRASCATTDKPLRLPNGFFGIVPANSLARTPEEQPQTVFELLSDSDVLTNSSVAPHTFRACQSHIGGNITV